MEGSGGDVGLGQSVTARDYAVQRLREADSPMSPAEIANEYGCTNGHLRNVLRDLRSEGPVERVRRGKYTVSETDADGSDSEMEPDVETDGEVSAYRESGDESAGIDSDPSVDGGPQSPDTDTRDRDDGNEEPMPSDEEIERQQELVEEARDGDQEDDVDGDDQEELVEDSSEPVEDSHRPADELGRTFDEEDEEIGVDEEPAGIPIPVSSTTLFVGVAVLLAIVIWWSRRDRSSSEDDEEEEPQDEQDFTEQWSQDTGVGLIE